jgi:hypothetical protein
MFASIDSSAISADFDDTAEATALNVSWSGGSFKSGASSIPGGSRSLPTPSAPPPPPVPPPPALTGVTGMAIRATNNCRVK